MSLKDLFNEQKYKYLASTSLTELTGVIESPEYVQAYIQRKSRVVPAVDYSKPENFARFGSAEKYYYDSITRTYKTYPYDGSQKEKILWELSSSHLDLHILENGYPRTTGYAVFSTSSLNATDTSEGYGAAGTASYEYISVHGGPHAGSGNEIYIDPDTGEAHYRENANIYDTADNRECNLKIGGTDGNTVEFWLKKEAFANTSTTKEVIFDAFTTSSISSSADYGRLRIELTGAKGSGGVGTAPFAVTYMSGTAGYANQIIGNSITTASIADDQWHHYSFRFKNSGSNITTDLFIDGEHNARLQTGTPISYVSGTIVGTLGALATHPSGTLAGAPRATKGWGKLSGSVDEFRFWKVFRNSEQVQTRWFDQVGGGTNTDTANTHLGVYYKFNEGITLTSSTDSIVLDYSGRVSNGTWVGYNPLSSRNIGSAIDEADLLLTNFSGSEFRDPIIYSNHPEVRSFLSTKRNEGKNYDYTNPSNIYYSIPSWILEEHDALDTKGDRIVENSLWNLTQIMSSYFDDVATNMQVLPSLAQPDYLTGTLKPPAFMDRILEAKNFVNPEIFSALTALETFESRDETRIFSDKVYDLKNLIYKNIYNNLTYIYKSKGTEKSFRNLVRCFGIDDEIYKFNVYSNNVDYTLRDNYRTVSEKNKVINFNLRQNSNATIYQYSSSLNTNSVTFLSGSGIAAENEEAVPFTVEANITFPFRADAYAQTRQLFKNADSYYLNYPVIQTSSLFGMHTAISSTPAKTTWAANDYANFVVKAIKPAKFSSKAHFVLTGTADGFIPELTSEEFNDVYDDRNWNFMVSVYPENYQNIDQIPGTSGSFQPNYIVEFRGMHSVLDTIIDEFVVSGTMTAANGRKFLGSPKRIFAGSHLTNFTGSLLNSCDVKFNNLRVWQNRLTREDLKFHAANPKNHGIQNPTENSYLFNTSINNIYVPKAETLLLNWSYENVTGSDGDGTFIVEDLTSGSSEQIDRYGWLSNLNKSQYLGKGHNFATSSAKVVQVDSILSAKPNLPEVMSSDDMIKVMQNDDIYFTRDKRPIFFDLYAEKSPYQNISEEMLEFMATVVDYNNLIGQPVNNYRHEYKAMNMLRQLFFQRIKNAPDIDKYVEYFKWFDLAVSSMIQKLAPMSSGLDERPLRTIIESHILERNKYRNKFPSYEFKQSDPQASLFGINEMLYDWKFGHGITGSDASQDDNCS